MRILKVCFVGVGSIAKRHIKNLLEICKEKKIELIIDACRREESQKDKELDKIFNTIYIRFEKLPTDYDAIFITNPTEYHIDALRRVHNCSDKFFIEKPLVSYQKLNEIERFPFSSDKMYYVACPLRYTKVIQYIKNEIAVDNVIGIRSISSSYLPDWRIDVDYRKSYSANKDMGGGVSIDLIHEWDYINYLFGIPRRVSSFLGKVSDLELDCEDYAIYIAQYENKIAELHLDYFGKKNLREVMLFTKDDTIVGDLIKSKITYLKSGKVVELAETRDDFHKQELKHFMKIIEGAAVCDNGINEALQILELTQGKVWDFR